MLRSFLEAGIPFLRISRKVQSCSPCTTPGTQARLRARPGWARLGSDPGWFRSSRDVLMVSLFKVIIMAPLSLTWRTHGKVFWKGLAGTTAGSKDRARMISRRARTFPPDEHLIMCAICNCKWFRYNKYKLGLGLGFNLDWIGLDWWVIGRVCWRGVWWAGGGWDSYRVEEGERLPNSIKTKPKTNFFEKLLDKIANFLFALTAVIFLWFSSWIVHLKVILPTFI